MGSGDSKSGITGHPPVRWGSYQNAYSRRSHIACFDLVYIGPSRAIASLEKVIKQNNDWAIERDGHGVTEWIKDLTAADVEKQVDEIIAGFKFKIIKVPKKFLPLTIDNYDALVAEYNLNE